MFLSLPGSRCLLNCFRPMAPTFGVNPVFLNKLYNLNCFSSCLHKIENMFLPLQRQFLEALAQIALWNK